MQFSFTQFQEVCVLCVAQLWERFVCGVCVCVTHTQFQEGCVLCVTVTGEVCVCCVCVV